MRDIQDPPNHLKGATTIAGELLEITHDCLRRYEYPEEPLLPRFKRLVLQADGAGFGRCRWGLRGV
jgi:hypothetical protein